MSGFQKKRGVPPKPIVEHPKALYALDSDHGGFPDALRSQMLRHGDSVGHLTKALAHFGHVIDVKAVKAWVEGRKAPSAANSFKVLAAIEHRYQLPEKYLQDRIGPDNRAHRKTRAAHITPAEQRRLAWHLPDDFDARPDSEQEEIFAWVRSTFVSGATEYRRFQAQAMKEPYSLALDGAKKRGKKSAPSSLIEEMSDLLRFKTSVLSAAGQKRNGRWAKATADQKVEHLGLLFGALSADPDGPNQGAGVPVDELSFAMLAVPKVWDWYIQWREQRRGFLTAWEVDMLNVVKSLVREETGWLRQRPQLGMRLRVIPNLINDADVAQASADWPGFCDVMHAQAAVRIEEIKSVAEVHRDPFEAILPILEADSPLFEYIKITDEIVRHMPDSKRHPKPAAESLRSLLMIRIGLHTGFRQKNLRELLLCPPGRMPTPERRLSQIKRGEIRWRPREVVWEIFVPESAFKNAGSTYFSSNPYCVPLPDVAGLYDYIDEYVRKSRRLLLADANDPGTFFVKSVKSNSTSAEYDDQSFYVAWRLIISRYGVFNPYTGNGAIPGLLPHGPHNIRDVLATEVLKRTGSFEKASYAIQDTVAVVAKHYGRFLPKDKAALAAEILNEVWRQGRAG